ncbi:hypothetical protein FBQ96_11415 [Nitrospirales bacterium NOB]|nr:MAG: hypothetical protein UZ03_NOB001001000 [Nitrospira sp. OLB3]MBV6468181.1 hypothetical protein [Nitrospirota bacterium]MCE7966898.1 hypothetical protein [Nitrospira sp. NTP2]MCK6494162.1 hypothetical protein [Nitrospira sp.]MDL1890169.1 hypothetical protein [Nitrospirales bacterium NOB]MEB2337413.1 hypothetical protein [Nitrospirales bacterium]
MASQAPPPKPGAAPPPKTQDVWDVELLHVLVSRKGQSVNAEWAIHPQIKADLNADEWKELGDLMRKVTTIVGNRFSQVLSKAEPPPPGNA